VVLIKLSFGYKTEKIKDLGTKSIR